MKLLSDFLLFYFFAFLSINDFLIYSKSNRNHLNILWSVESVLYCIYMRTGTQTKAHWSKKKDEEKQKFITQQHRNIAKFIENFNLLFVQNVYNNIFRYELEKMEKILPETISRILPICRREIHVEYEYSRKRHTGVVETLRKIYFPKK